MQHVAYIFQRDFSYGKDRCRAHVGHLGQGNPSPIDIIQASAVASLRSDQGMVNLSVP